MSDVVTVIEARPSTLPDRLRAVWSHRSFYPLLLREISMRKFRATLFGFWWLVIRPLVPTVMAVITFTFFLPLNTEGVPYPIFYFAGFITWNIFQASIQFMPRTMLWMRGMMKKIYFPKLLVPIASIGPPLMELAIVFTMFMLTVIVLYIQNGVFYIELGWNLLAVLPCMILALVLGLSIGMVTSMIALYVRDVVFSVGYFAQLAMLVTPVLYPITVVPESVRWIVYILNPMAAIVETSRWAFTGQGEFSPLWFALSAMEICGITALCLIFFLRAETYLADAL
jgi:homopolymeric O-antigen transport system permease protein